MDAMLLADVLAIIADDPTSVQIWDPPSEAFDDAEARNVWVSRANQEDQLMPGRRNMQIVILLAKDEDAGRATIRQGSTRVKIATYPGQDPTEHTVAAIESEDAGGWFLRLS